MKREIENPKPLITFGPKVPGAGSWEWLGEDLARGLSETFETATFGYEVPDCDGVVFIKYLPPVSVLREISERAAVVYCPVDVYGSAAEIDADAGLSWCDRIVVHCAKLAKYTRSYAPTISMDHHLKFAAPIRTGFVAEGPLLWVGVRTNLPPVIDWLAKQRWKDEIWILTNPEQPDDLHSPKCLGLPEGLSFRLGEWTPDRHFQWVAEARAVFDVKGRDFRSRHKPAAKAMDFLASGLPLAMNRDSSSVEAIQGLGFEIASLDDRERWLSKEYWEQTRSFAALFRERFSLSQMIPAWSQLLRDVIEEKKTFSVTNQNQLAVSSRFAPENGTTVFPSSAKSSRRTRVGIVSLLFNWPSTGGGTIHTLETARFLQRAGYQVSHFYVKSAAWDVGRVDEPLDYPAEPILWEPAEDGLAQLQRQLRKGIEAFAPDFVILTDSWTMKPRLAEAVEGCRFFLRLAAQECLCPLNNVRMLVDDLGRISRCPRHQLATPEICRDCITVRGSHSGVLHQRERELAGFGTPEYDQALRWSFSTAEAVLVVNPLIEAMVSPFAKRTRVVPSGFDPARFPWPWPAEQQMPDNVRIKILFAGLPQELMKGFPILHAGCERLWEIRQDFELWITDDPVGQRDSFTKAIGWQSQADLPQVLRQCDLLVFPTVAEEALGRTAVEAMAVGRPVVASRIGGLPWTISDGGTGLLFEPGNAVDLAEKLTQLLDDPVLREQLGRNGRQRFETEFVWKAIVDRHYRPLLGEPVRTG